MLTGSSMVGKVAMLFLILVAILSGCEQSYATPTVPNTRAPNTPQPPTEPPPISPTVDAPTELPPSATPTPEPSAFSKRIYHVSVYDSESEHILILGGQSFHNWGMDLKDVWAIDGISGEWEQMADMPGSMYCAAYDKESDRVIGLTWELGGQTWAYDFNQDVWQNMRPTESPGDLAGCRMVYDEESDRIILFGGFRGSTTSLMNNRTWAYDYNANTWTLMEPIESPPERAYHDMAYDADSDRIVMWGGRPLTESEDSQVWVYDYNANEWLAMPVSAGTPPIRSTYHSMAYHPGSDQILVYGGIQGDEQVLVDDLLSYHYDSNSWAVGPSIGIPAGRAIHSMVYSEVDGRFLLSGGEADFLYSGHILDEVWWFEMVSGEWIRFPLP